MISRKFNVVVHSLIVDEADIEEEILSPIADIKFVPEDKRDDFYKLITEADGIIIADRKMDVNTIQRLSKCKVISRQGVGVDNIDLKAAKKKNIIVKNVENYCIEDVANYTVANILALTKYLHIYNEHVKNGIWNVESVFDVNKLPPIRRISTQTLGVVGFGRISHSVVKKMKNFGINILIYDPYLCQKTKKEDKVSFVDFETLLQRADIITLHTPLTQETKHMFDIEVFKKMKRTAFLINTSRGPVVNEEDLYIALKKRLIAGAAIDVMEKEPPNKDNPLFKLNNIIITPHIAFLSEDSYKELREKAAENVKNVLLDWLQK